MPDGRITYCHCHCDWSITTQYDISFVARTNHNKICKSKYKHTYKQTVYYTYTQFGNPIGLYLVSANRWGHHFGLIDCRDVCIVSEECGGHLSVSYTTYT